jgi:hypothetical protein
MARPLDLTDLAGAVRYAYLTVNAAIPVPFATAGIVETEPSAQEEHVMQLREAAFAMVLGELLENEYYADPVDLRTLESGRVPVRAPEPGAGR